MVLIIPEGWDLKVDKQWFICVAILFISYVSSLHAMQKMITKFFSFQYLQPPFFNYKNHSSNHSSPCIYGHRNKNNVPWNIPIDPVGLTVVIQKVSLLTNWTPYCSTNKIPKQPDYGISRNSNPNPSYRVTLYLSLFLCWYTSSNFERNCLLIESCTQLNDE